MILQHSAGPIRWMPTGSSHRAIVDRAIIIIDGANLIELDAQTRTRFLDPSLEHTDFTDPVIANLSMRFAGLRPLTDGGLWEGLLTSIIGQAVSLHSAAAFQRRLCELLSPQVISHGREFRSLPNSERVAECSMEQIRGIGLTTKRAEGLIAVARQFADDNVLHPQDNQVEEWMKDHTRLPMVGPWTAASALLWGVGHTDVYPSGDVALLRAAKLAYDDDGMTMQDLNTLSERWRPQRAIAARLLWTNLLGMGWDD